MHICFFISTKRPLKFNRVESLYFTTSSSNYLARNMEFVTSLCTHCLFITPTLTIRKDASVTEANMCSVVLGPCSTVY